VDHRQLVRTISAGRIVVGATLILAPGAAARLVGPSAREPGVKVLTRALGVRDLAIGAGTLKALADGEPARDWALAGAAGDLMDGVAALVAIRHLGVRRAVPLIAVAKITALATWSAARHID
jgi:hypothetical protein